jgi:hypothetical protein
MAGFVFLGFDSSLRASNRADSPDSARVALFARLGKRRTSIANRRPQIALEADRAGSAGGCADADDSGTGNDGRNWRLRDVRRDNLDENRATIRMRIRRRGDSAGRA